MTCAGIFLKSKCDVVVASGRPAWVVAFLTKNLLHKKTVVILHGTDIRSLGDSAKANILRFLLKHCGEIWFTAPDVAPLASAIRKSAQSLKFPIDTTIFNPVGPTTELEGCPSVLVPTRLDWTKDGAKITDLIIDIIHDYPKSVVHVLEWPTSEKRLIARLLSECPRDQIRIRPLVASRPLLASYYRGAQVVLGQLRYGIGSMIELESMSCGTPVLFYDTVFGYGCDDSSLDALEKFFDLLVRNKTFREAKVRRGYDVARGYGASAVYSEFRECFRDLATGSS